MRPLPFLSAILLSAATPVFAQVTVDLHALQALPQHGGVPPTHDLPTHDYVARDNPTRDIPGPHKSARVTSGAPAPGAAFPGSASGSAPGSASTAVSSLPGPSRSAPSAAPAEVAPPPIPQTAPDVAAITPIAPAAPPAAPSSAAQSSAAPSSTASFPPGATPTASSADQAATGTAPTAANLRLSFAAGQSDLSPESLTSIKQLIAATPADGGSVNVSAYAPGRPDDPSTARRVSLSRAMAVRSALISDGVPSTRIYLRALGAQYGEGPADRVDVTVLGATLPGDTAAQAAPR